MKRACEVHTTEEYSGFFDFPGYVYRTMKTSTHTSRLHAPYAVLKLFLILHCVLSFNHFMTSPLVCRSVDNFDNLRVFSTQTVSDTKSEKRYFRNIFQSNGFIVPALLPPSCARPDGTRGSCLHRCPPGERIPAFLSSIRMIV